MVQQVVLQSHILSTYRALKATSPALWSYYVCLQDVSVFQPWKCNSRLFISFYCQNPSWIKERPVLTCIHVFSWLLVYKTKELPRYSTKLVFIMMVLSPSLRLWWIWSIVHCSICNAFFVAAVFVHNLYLYLNVPGRPYPQSFCVAFWIDFHCSHLWNVFQQ